MTLDDLIAARIAYTRPPAVAKIQDRASRLEAEGIKLKWLLRGEPDFDTPAHIRQAAIEALQSGKTHYPPIQGIPELRRAVADRMWRDFAMLVDPQTEVIITTGATMGLYIAIQAVLNPGDEVIIPDPVYDPYPTVIKMAGGAPVRVAAQAHEGHFMIARETIEAALTNKTKAILVNNPWNPAASVMTREELHDLIEVAEAHNLILFVDEIYEKIIFGKFIHINLASLSPQARVRTITINSFSKTYAMTGWRLGYNVAPRHLTQAMLRISQQLSRSAATFIQYAGVAALEGPLDSVTSMVNTYKQRRDLITQGLGGIRGMSFFPPEGTFFVMLDVRSFMEDSESMADYLLDQARVVTVPGNVYGQHGEGYIRLSFACDEETLNQAIEGMVKTLERL